MKNWKKLLACLLLFPLKRKYPRGALFPRFRIPPTCVAFFMHVGESIIIHESRRFVESFLKIVDKNRRAVIRSTPGPARRRSSRRCFAGFFARRRMVAATFGPPGKAVSKRFPNPVNARFSGLKYLNIVMMTESTKG